MAEMSIKEDLIYYIWQSKILSQHALTTEDGQIVKIIDYGMRNEVSGPDFSNAKVKIGDVLWAGNIEMHVLASDWLLHKHQHDEAYNNVILHVVYESDKSLPRDIPTLVIKPFINTKTINTYHQIIGSWQWLPCANLWQSKHAEQLSLRMEHLAISRLEQKVSTIHQLLESCNTDWVAVLYHQLAKYITGPTNKDVSEQLSKNIAFSTFVKNSYDVIINEAILFGVGGFLMEDYPEDTYYTQLQKEYKFQQHKHKLVTLSVVSWRYGKMMPMGFPTIRLAQFASLLPHLERICQLMIDPHTSLDNVTSLFYTTPNAYWSSHYVFGKPSDEKQKPITKDLVNRLLINAVIPIMFAYGQLRNQDSLMDKAVAWLEQVPAESNAIINKWKAFGLKPQSALDTQALLQQKTMQCDAKRCLSCTIGYGILRGVE